MITAQQYHLDTITRTLEVPGIWGGDGGDPSGGATALRVTGGNDQGRGGDRCHQPVRKRFMRVSANEEDS